MYIYNICICVIDIREKIILAMQRGLDPDPDELRTHAPN